MAATQQRFLSLPAEMQLAVRQQLTPIEYARLIQVPVPPGSDLMAEVEAHMNTAAANYAELLPPFPPNVNRPCLLNPVMTQVIQPYYTVVTPIGEQGIYTYELLRWWWYRYTQGAGLLTEDNTIVPDELMQTIFNPVPASYPELEVALLAYIDCATPLAMTPDVLIYLNTLEI